MHRATLGKPIADRSHCRNWLRATGTVGPSTCLTFPPGGLAFPRPCRTSILPGRLSIYAVEVPSGRVVLPAIADDDALATVRSLEDAEDGATPLPAEGTLVPTPMTSRPWARNQSVADRSS